MRIVKQDVASRLTVHLVIGPVIATLHDGAGGASAPIIGRGVPGGPRVVMLRDFNHGATLLGQRAPARLPLNQIHFANHIAVHVLGG